MSEDYVDSLRMLFFVRTDLKMTKGKLAAQVGHAVQALVLTQILGVPTPEFLEWMVDLHTKICLKVNSEDELLHFYKLGVQQDFASTKIVDEGLTQFQGVKTNTVVGWGPMYKSVHTPFTSHLKLL